MKSHLIIQLYDKMEQQLSALGPQLCDTIALARASNEIIQNSILTLKQHILEQGFADEEEEIDFFKNHKPRFYSQLIYFNKIIQIELARPVFNRKMQLRFLIEEQNRLIYFYRKHSEFYRYLRSQERHSDRKYFLRNEKQFANPTEWAGIDKDPQFATSHDFVAAKLSAYEKLERYLSDERGKLKKKQVPASLSDINWTGTKASLIELLYAVHCSGVINHGNTTLQQIARFFETIFNTSLGNYYRAFQEIRIRKKNRTQFIDDLKRKLEAKMDYDDENPRP